MTRDQGHRIDDARDGIEAFLDRARVEEDVPGLSVAVFESDGLRHSTGMGAREIDSRSPATPQTRFPIGSVTKLVTAVAVLQQVARSGLSLDDEIVDAVDVWSDVPGDPITVAELLSHASGMPTDYAGEHEPGFADATPTSPIVTRADDRRHADGAADRRIVDPDRYLYSNRGYQLLGELLETVTDRPFAEYVDAEIFTPLEMYRSQVGYGDRSTANDDTATGYVIEDGEPVAGAFDLDSEVRPPHSAGGLLSSVVDLATFGRCLLNEGTIDGTTLLSPEWVAEMQAYQSPTLERIDGGRVGYGFGPRIQPLDGARLFEHAGTSPARTRAYLGLVPERDLGVALAANTPGASVGTLGQGVLAIALGDQPHEVVPALALQRKLDRVSGTYHGYRGGVTVRVRVPDSQTHLVVDYQNGPGWTFPAFPESLAHDEYRFYTLRGSGLREPVVFEATDSGFELRCNVDRLVRDAGSGDRA